MSPAPSRTARDAALHWSRCPAARASVRITASTLSSTARHSSSRSVVSACALRCRCVTTSSAVTVNDRRNPPAASPPVPDHCAVSSRYPLPCNRNASCATTAAASSERASAASASRSKPLSARYNSANGPGDATPSTWHAATYSSRTVSARSPSESRPATSNAAAIITPTGRPDRRRHPRSGPTKPAVPLPLPPTRTPTCEADRPTGPARRATRPRGQRDHVRHGTRRSTTATTAPPLRPACRRPIRTAARCPEQPRGLSERRHVLPCPSMTRSRAIRFHGKEKKLTQRNPGWVPDCRARRWTAAISRSPSPSRLRLSGERSPTVTTSFGVRPSAINST